MPARCHKAKRVSFSLTTASCSTGKTGVLSPFTPLTLLMRPESRLAADLVLRLWTCSFRRIPTAHVTSQLNLCKQTSVSKGIPTFLQSPFFVPQLSVPDLLGFDRAPRQSRRAISSDNPTYQSGLHQAGMKGESLSSASLTVRAAYQLLLFQRG